MAGTAAGQKPRSRRDQELSRRGFTFTVTVLLASLVTAYLAHLAAPSAPAWLRGRLDSYSTLWPQGWSFFTGLGTNDVVVAYRVGPSDTLAVPADERDQWSFQRWGFDRSGDTSAVELGQLAITIPQQYWQGCAASDPGKCRVQRASGHYLTIANRSSNPGLCGLIAIAVEHPAELSSGTPPRKPATIYRVALVNLTCPG